MSLNTDVLDRIVRQQKATLDVTITSIAVRLIHVFLNQSPVLGVNPWKNAFHRGFGRSVVSIDSKGFFRPEHLACGKSATEAAGDTTFRVSRGESAASSSLPWSGKLRLGSGTDDYLVHINIGGLLDRERNSAGNRI